MDGKIRKCEKEIKALSNTLDHLKVRNKNYRDKFIQGAEGADLERKQILEDYKGKVRFIFKHFPLSFHANAQKAAEAAECAGEQGRFWEMHDKIFEANESGTMSVSQWKTAAKALGLNTSKFNDCLDSGKYADQVAADMAEGQAAGVTGTPGTFVNGDLVKGAVPYEQLKSIIDSKL